MGQELIAVSKMFFVSFDANTNTANVVLKTGEEGREIILASIKAIDGRCVFVPNDFGLEVEVEFTNLNDALKALSVAYTTIEKHMVSHLEEELPQTPTAMDDSVEDETFDKEPEGIQSAYEEMAYDALNEDDVKSDIINYDEVPTEAQINA